jgi:uncharacterized protein
VKTVFIDTWAYIALANRRDAGHLVALEVDQFLNDEGWVQTTSDWVLDETVTQLHALAGANVVLRFLDDLDAQLRARQLILLNVSTLRFEASVRTFRSLAPRVPRLSLTDSTTFTLMSELDVRWAFTADKHFYSAGPHIGPMVSLVDGEFIFRPPVA